MHFKNSSIAMISKNRNFGLDTWSDIIIKTLSICRFQYIFKTLNGKRFVDSLNQMSHQFLKIRLLVSRTLIIAQRPFSNLQSVWHCCVFAKKNCVANHCTLLFVACKQTGSSNSRKPKDFHFIFFMPWHAVSKF